MNCGKNLAPRTAAALLCAILAGCGGGSGGSSPSALSLPDGATLLPNGTVVSLARYAADLGPGKTTDIGVQVAGGVGSASALGLTANVDRVGPIGTMVGNDPQYSVLPTARLVTSSAQNGAGAAGLSVTKLVIDAGQAAPGNYVVKLTSGGLSAGTVMIAVQPSAMIKTAYVQLDASGSLGAITTDGYAASNMVVFAFADLGSPTISSAHLGAVQTAIDGEGAGTINLLSIGGQYATPATINAQTADQIVANVSAQINQYNDQLKGGGTISGVDLDLENSIDGATIEKLAYGFKSKGLIVSIAPQVITTDGMNVDPNNPTNLGLSSGGNNDQYGAALAAGDVDYVLAQTYNSGGWTVGGVQENSVQFFSEIAKALNNTVRGDCTGSAVLCIPNTVQIVVGEPSNGGASGTVNNIFASNGSGSYAQANILTQLQGALPAALAYSNVDGVMQWSLNNDYDPSAWGDTSAAVGAFTGAIFGAPPPVSLPYFILQISNTGPNVPGPLAYGTVTLVVNGQYWVFGTNAPWTPAKVVPVAPLENQEWGTLPSSKNPATPGVVDSNNLDRIFSNGVTSFTATQILVNGYSSRDADIGKPARQWGCTMTNYQFAANHSYNLMFNPTNGACALTQVN